MRWTIVRTITILLCLVIPATAWAQETSPDIYYSGIYKIDETDIINGLFYDILGLGVSSEIQGVWESPAVMGLDTDSTESQDYAEPQELYLTGANGEKLSILTNGPHSAYLNSTRKCRECHEVDRASGEFKLTRNEARFESCEWCHDAGASASSNVQMDNDSELTTEYGVGHTMGYGISSGKWKAPGDTYPAFTPNYWMGGFSCLDCHSLHGIKKKLIGFSNDGTESYQINNPGYNGFTSSFSLGTSKFPAGSWFLLKNPDKEIEPTTGIEITDTDTAAKFDIHLDGRSFKAAVNKHAINWDRPIGSYERSSGGAGEDFYLSEFCADCHDGYTGSYNQKAITFNEDRALLGLSELNSYALSESHDSNQRPTGLHIHFDTEDAVNSGPACRSCHMGSSDCKICHDTSSKLGGSKVESQEAPYSDSFETTTSPTPGNWGGYECSSVVANPACCNIGFSWPHKTLSWKLLKNNLFGVDFDGVTPVGPGKSRELAADVSAEAFKEINNTGILGPAHDLDSVCLDCHNPFIWNPQFKNELILKGLP